MGSYGMVGHVQKCKKLILLKPVRAPQASGITAESTKVSDIALLGSVNRDFEF